MYIKNISIENFRNYKKLDLELINGINLFLGDNAQGKTNFLESIYLLSFAKSYRATKENEMILLNQNYFKIDLSYVKNNLNSKLEYYFDNKNKVIKKNDVKIKKISDLVGEIFAVSFLPEDLEMMQGNNVLRRKFIDILCCQISKKYMIKLQEYNKLIKIKNKVLKNYDYDKNYEYLIVLNDKLSDLIFDIVAFRKAIFEKMLFKAKDIILKLTNEKEKLDISYNCEFLNLTKDQIKKLLNDSLKLDFIRKTSIKGVHKDSFKIYLNDLDTDKFSSQGQKRTVLLTLKLSHFELIKELKEEIPILLLDDIMSELDNERINFLFKYIENYQSIITTTDLKFNYDSKNIKKYIINSGDLKSIL